MNDDFQGRLKKLRDLMAQKDAQVFICDHGEMLLWLTGYSVSETRYRACIVPAIGDPVWVLRSIDEAPCRRATWVNEVKTFADHEDPFKCIARVIADLGASAFAIAADYNSYGHTACVSQKLKEVLPDASWVNLHDASNQLRVLKEPSEIKRLREAAAIADGAMAALVEQLKPGMRPRDAAAVAASYYLQQGADDWWVGPIAISKRAGSSSSDMGFLHQTLNDEVLHQGDVLHVELVPRVACYSARIMRSICIGTPDESQLSIMDRMVVLQDNQIASMVPGAVAADVDRGLREAILHEGIRSTYDNATGYQIGLYTKTPRSSDFSLYFHPEADWTLASGMTFHMYLSAQGLAISDSVLVTDAGTVRLTQTNRALLSALST